MCSPIDEMEQLSISPQASEEGALHSLISFDRLSFKGSFADVSEFDESVGSDYSPSDVFREGGRVIAEEMMFVLKRANPVTEYRDEGDIVDSPIAKRKRRTYHYHDDDTDECSTNEFDERDGVEELSHDPLDCNYEQVEDEAYLTVSTSESTSESRRSQQMSNILDVLHQASNLTD